MDLSKTSFPVYDDGVKTKEDFIQRAKKGLQSKNEEILTFIDNGNVQGLIHYYVIEADKYIGINFLSIASAYAKALRELLDYWHIRYSGYEWNLYFPEQNADALSYMAQSGQKDAEQSVVEVLLFDEYHIQPESDSVISITKKIIMSSPVFTICLKRICIGPANVYWKKWIAGKFLFYQTRVRFTITEKEGVILRYLVLIFVKRNFPLIFQNHYSSPA
jgi:hypothetical protein